MKKLYIVLGSIFLFLGVLGIALPLLPTTPFVLLSAYFYSKGSNRLYSWLIGHGRLGEFIRQYKEKRIIPLKAKIHSLSLLWITFSINAYCFLWSKHLILGIYFLVCILVTLHILSFKSRE